MLRVIVVIVAVTFGAGVGIAREAPEGLFAECSPMDVEVVVNQEAMQTVGLTKEMVEKVAVSQLLLEELYVPLAGQIPGQMQALAITIETRHLSWSFRLQLGRLIDLGYGVSGYAVVWEDGFFGSIHTPENALESFLSLVVRAMNGFLTEYLRANEDGNPEKLQWCTIRPAYEKWYHQFSSEAPEKAASLAKACWIEEAVFGEGNAVSSWCD